MRECRTSGSVQGVMSDHDSYCDYWLQLLSSASCFADKTRVDILSTRSPLRGSPCCRASDWQIRRGRRSVVLLP